MTNNKPPTKDVFNAASQKPAEDQEAKQDQTPPQEKLTSEPMSFTIFGTQGGRANVSIETDDGTLEAELEFDASDKEEINLDRTDINHEEEILGINVLLRIDEHGLNPEGIDGGRITRMTLTEGEKGNENILAHFDKGDWEHKPKTPLEIQVMMRAKKEQNGLKMPEVKPAFDQTQKVKIKP